jgi:predicted nuclease of restriction endonuclease-like RecB superfamily
MVIPVLLIGFNRPEFLNRRVEEIVQMNVPRLYISIDGGDGQTESLMKNALSKIERMDTKNTSIIINHHNSSLGLVNHITSAIDGVLSQHKKVIIVEDDIKLTNNFYVNIYACLH